MLSHLIDDDSSGLDKLRPHRRAEVRRVEGGNGAVERTRQLPLPSPATGSCASEIELARE